jgi:sugar O-acyltransferase (sialic acid O-acetyltransferase NeuD family)
VNRIAIIGFGALGVQILKLISVVEQPEELVLFDNVLHGRGEQNAFPFESFLEQRFSDFSFYVALGYLHLPRKLEILDELHVAGRRTPSVVHPSCEVNSTSRIGDGCVVYPLCNVGDSVDIERGVLLNNSVVVSHGSRVGAAAYLSPGVVLSGNVIIGCQTFLGSGVVVANGRRIGANVRVGIGSVVTVDIPDNLSAIGNPLKLLSRPLDLE